MFYMVRTDYFLYSYYNPAARGMPYPNESIYLSIIPYESLMAPAKESGIRVKNETKNVRLMKKMLNIKKL